MIIPLKPPFQHYNFTLQLSTLYVPLQVSFYTFNIGILTTIPSPTFTTNSLYTRLLFFINMRGLYFTVLALFANAPLVYADCQCANSATDSSAITAAALCCGGCTFAGIGKITGQFDGTGCDFTGNAKFKQLAVSTQVAKKSWAIALVAGIFSMESNSANFFTRLASLQRGLAPVVQQPGRSLREGHAHNGQSGQTTYVC